MKKFRNNINIFSPNLYLLSLLVMGVWSLIISCETEDDIPPPSAYVKPAPEPEPEECDFSIPIVPELVDGINFECGGPEVTFFGEKDGSFTVNYIENPHVSGINTSDRVVEYIQTEGIEPWAGFFFQLASKVDFSELQTIKIKVYSPAADQNVLLKFEDSADGSIAKEVQAITTVANQWEELSFAFSESDSNKFDKMVLFFNFNGEKDAPTTHYFDDIVMGEGGGTEEPVDTTEPTAPAATPTVDPMQVISLFSDAYTDVAGTDFNPNWGQGTIASQVDISGNNTLKYENLNYQGTQFASSIDASGMTMLHVDYWTADSSTLDGYLISSGPAETAHSFAITTGEWVSVDIPLSEFSSAVDLSDIIQLKFVGDGTVYLDNIYFYASPATEPTTVATTPSVAGTDVISLFSDAYSNVSVDTWRTDWSVATLEDLDIDGNAVKKYSGLNFVGIETVANQIDASGMTHFHTDVWTADATEIRIKLVDFGADGTYDGGDDTEHEITISDPEQNTWLSLEIPLTDFTGLTSRSNIAQLIYAGQPVGSMAIFVDNVYFHK